MLDSRRPPQIIAGLPVFHDHEDERRRYPVASVPRLVADPEPQISLVLFREPEPGGLLQFAVELRPTADELEAIRRELSTAGPPPHLLRPDWRAGRVSLLGWLNGPELPPRDIVVGEASLVGDPMAIVSARLDAAGAALAAAALRGDSLPTVVLFEVETLGLEGPLEARASADLRAIHERLTAEGALTTPYGAARLAATWESMQRDNLIRVEIMAETVHADGYRIEALRRVGTDIVSRMFSPVPPAERPSRLDNGAIAPIELSFRLTARRETLATSAQWDFRERRAVPLRHHAAASLIDMLGRAYDPVELADLAALRRTLVVRAEPELPRLGLAALEVDVRESDTEGPAHTVVLTNDTPEVRLTARTGATNPAFRVRTRFDPTLTNAADRQSEWQQMPGALAVVSARRLFPPRTISILAGRAEFDWLEEVQARLTVEGEPTRVARLTQDQPAATVFLAGGAGRPAWLEMSWRGRAGEPGRVEEPRLLTDDTVVVDSPFGPSMEVVVLVASGRLPGIASVVVELRSTQPGFTHERTLEFGLPTDEAQRVRLRRLAGAPWRYEFRVQYIREDGTLVEQPWTTTESAVLVAGGGSDAVRLDEVEVFVGGGPAGRGSAAIEFTLSAGRVATTAIVEGTTDLARLALVLPAEAPASVLVAREFREAGQVLKTRWSPPERFVVMPPLSPEL